ncbi:tetratricopeptide repeat protein [Phormidium sp. FACHB-592]|uniref:Transglutaminase-like domain-containing protein n=1 Tax=Stenomitos frigidus AS-A4 TaxID=2933935 RepID=A0ABV0KFD3_9CYAN|nr:transglutaminase-like domain-containing protein [Phormidium sp. FACHB-592]MBD2076545.1 tetratricopeptide repeat protein [Phormidium sp. FACHB-592]
MNRSLARQLFQREVQQPDEQIHLERAALYIAQEEYPELEVEAYLNALETMAADVEERLPIEFYPLKIIQTINRYLYDDLGFAGNTTDYYDPRNSFLNEVIDRRTGIPITLSLVYLAIARRVGLPMVGINMPGHFLIRPDLEDVEICVDPFHRGDILFPQDCEERLAQVYGRPVALKPSFLQAVTTRQYLTRMLTNLKVTYIDRGKFDKALAVVDRLLLLVPNAPLELRDRGILYYRLDRPVDAQHDLEAYLSLSPTAAEAPAIRELLATIRQANQPLSDA